MVSKMTHILVYDYHRHFSEKIIKRFPDKSRYTLSFFINKQAFINHCQAISGTNSCVVSIIFYNEPIETIGLLNDFLSAIKETCANTSIIIVSLLSNLEEIKMRLTTNIDDIIPVNNNTILRIHNTVKRVFIEYNILYYRKRRDNTLKFTILVLATAIITFLTTYYLHPEIF